MQGSNPTWHYPFLTQPLINLTYPKISTRNRKKILSPPPYFQFLSKIRGWWVLAKQNTGYHLYLSMFVCPFDFLSFALTWMLSNSFFFSSEHKHARNLPEFYPEETFVFGTSQQVRRKEDCVETVLTKKDDNIHK